MVAKVIRDWVPLFPSFSECARWRLVADPACGCSQISSGFSGTRRCTVSITFVSTPNLPAPGGGLQGRRVWRNASVPGEVLAVAGPAPATAVPALGGNAVKWRLFSRRQTSVDPSETLRSLDERLSAIEQFVLAKPKPMDRIAEAFASGIEERVTMDRLLDTMKASLIADQVGRITKRKRPEQPRGPHGYFLPKEPIPSPTRCRLCANPQIHNPTREEIIAHYSHNGIASEA